MAIYRQTDRWTDRQILRHHIQGGSRLFLSVKFATSLLASLDGENLLDFNGISNIYCDRNKKHRMLNQLNKGISSENMKYSFWMVLWSQQKFMVGFLVLNIKMLIGRILVLNNGRTHWFHRMKYLTLWVV